MISYDQTPHHPRDEGTPSLLEYAKLKRENDELLKLVGLMTLKLSEAQKKK